MEQDIFTWEDFDEASYQCLQFYKCKFVKDFGPFKAGTFVGTICIEFSTGEITVYENYEDKDPIFTGKLRLELC